MKRAESPLLCLPSPNQAQHSGIYFTVMLSTSVSLAAVAIRWSKRKPSGHHPPGNAASKTG